jgi:hypothetical protein
MFEGVQTLNRSRIHEFSTTGIRSVEYWTYQPGKPDAQDDEEEWSRRLEEALVASVARAVADDPDVFVSLSAGYDSRALAGVLTRRLGLTGVQSFCYAPGTPAATSETSAAAATARTLGLGHRTLAGYRGDLLGHLRVNADWTEGMARPSDELDAWIAMTTAFEPCTRPAMLAGDMNFGLGPKPKLSFDTLRADLRFHELRVLGGAERLLSDEVLGQMEQGVIDDIDAMIRRADPDLPVARVREYIGFDQRLTNNILPWRERFAGRMAAVRNPWLDSAILDIVTAMPYRFRADRYLYKTTVRRMFPDLFVHERTQSQNMPDLGAALLAQAPALRRWIEGSESALDALMPPEFGSRLLDMSATPSGRVRQSLSRLRFRTHRRIARAGRGLVPGPGRRAMPGPDIFRRWAILRMALQPEADRL